MGLANAAAAVGVGFSASASVFGHCLPLRTKGSCHHSPCGRVPFAATVRAAMPMAARRARAGVYQIPLVIVTLRDVFHRFFNMGGGLPSSLRVCA